MPVLFCSVGGSVQSLLSSLELELVLEANPGENLVSLPEMFQHTPEELSGVS